MTQIESRQGGDFHSPGASISQIHTVRVVAMLGVFLHHLWNTVILTPTGPFQWGLDVLFDTASDGVILFNMLSGFLLALPYLGPERRPFVGYRIFLHRRFLRIVPPYFLALVLFSLANVLVFGIPPVSALHNLLWHLSFLNSLDYSMMSTNFSHFWYLGMLAQFYLLFPLALLSTSLISLSSDKPGTGRDDALFGWGSAPRQGLTAAQDPLAGVDFFRRHPQAPHAFGKPLLVKSGATASTQ